MEGLARLMGRFALSGGKNLVCQPESTDERSNVIVSQ
jgi:hypothetical protein